MLKSWTRSWRGDSRTTCACAWLLALLSTLVFLFSAGCTSMSKSAPVSVDRRNPESVIRAYFDAWEHGDWSGQAAFMDKKYERMVPEPVESVRLLEVRPLGGSSATLRVYSVVFEIKVKGEGVSMESGRYDWTYKLTWDAQRGSWLISNYGAG